MSAVETIEFGRGLHAHIYHNADVEQPFAHDDDVRIVVLHRRYIDPSQGAIGRNPDEVAAWERENAREWFTIPLFLYDRSGTAYRVGYSNPFHCRWDSGRVGIIALRRESWGSGCDPDDKLLAYAQSIAETYSEWANGECYGYVICDAHGEELDSCWGFIGFDAVREEAVRVAAFMQRKHSEKAGAP